MPFGYYEDDAVLVAYHAITCLDLTNSQFNTEAAQDLVVDPDNGDFGALVSGFTTYMSSVGVLVYADAAIKVPLYAVTNVDKAGRTLTVRGGKTIACENDTAFDEDFLPQYIAILPS